MKKTHLMLVRSSAAKWAADSVNHEQLERLAQAEINSGSFLDPSPTAAHGPFELFYRLIEPENFTREDTADFWSQFPFEWPEDLEEQSEIVQIFCDTVLEAIE